MLLTIIPFFLAAQFSLDENYQERYRWRFGGESIYDISVNVSRSSYGGENARPSTVCSLITGELECRAKDTESLGCRFRTGRMESTRAVDSTGCYRSGEIFTRENFFDREPFEIRFHSRGIENLVVRRTIPRWKLVIIKAVVAQLDVTVDLDREPWSYVALENSTTFGSCELDLKVHASGRWPRENENEIEFDIVPVGSVTSRSANVLAREGNIIIEKIRQPEKCPGRATYFFGYASNNDSTERGTFFDTVSSRSRTVISKRSFSSQTLSQGAVVGPDGSTMIETRQSITLTLKTVHPANGIFPGITEPASTGLRAFSTFDRYFKTLSTSLRAFL